jgi:hypothetical protein
MHQSYMSLALLAFGTLMCVAWFQSRGVFLLLVRLMVLVEVIRLVQVFPFHPLEFQPFFIFDE